MAEVRVDIVSDFKERGFKKAQSATDRLEKSFKRLGKQIASVFAARQLIRFTRDSVQAFAAEEKAIKSLSFSLQNLGLAFEGANIEKYLKQTERTTSVAAGELRPAFQQLVGATLDVSKAQDLLNTALNISAVSGKDLSSVTNALSRAYLNDVGALGKLNIGLTGAQLKTMSFAEVQDELNKKFGGAASKQAETYAGKIAALDNAFNNARETIGEKFIRALENVAEGDFDKVLDGIANAADKVGDAFIRISYTQRALKAALSGNFSQIAKLQEQMDLELAGGFGVRGRVPAGVLAKQTAEQRKLLKQAEAARKKAEAEAKKREALEKARKRANTIFDMENIQIVAALQGKIDGEQRTRLVTLLALNTENYKAAEKLADVVVRLNEPALRNLGVMIEAGDSVDDLIKKLITSQAKLAALQLTAEDFPELDNPFEEWENSLEKILEMLMKILAMNTTQKMQFTPLPPRPKTGYGSGFSDIEWMRMLQQMEKVGIAYDPGNFGEAGLSGALGSSSTTNAPTTVVVNVAGNVTTESDLVKRIADEFYQYQKSGSQILFRGTGL